VTRYLYDASGRFFMDLPARDLDDDTLSGPQRETLRVAVKAGLYRKAVAAPVKEKQHGSEQRNGIGSTTGS
jgi:hypothetical protein